jgi:hypothetical protein
MSLAQIKSVGSVVWQTLDGSCEGAWNASG